MARRLDDQPVLLQDVPPAGDDRVDIVDLGLKVAVGQTGDDRPGGRTIGHQHLGQELLAGLGMGDGDIVGQLDVYHGVGAGEGDIHIRRGSIQAAHDGHHLGNAIIHERLAPVVATALHVRLEGVAVLGNDVIKGRVAVVLLERSRDHGAVGTNVGLIVADAILGHRLSSPGGIGSHLDGAARRRRDGSALAGRLILVEDIVGVIGQAVQVFGVRGHGKLLE